MKTYFKIFLIPILLLTLTSTRSTNNNVEVFLTKTSSIGDSVTSVIFFDNGTFNSRTISNGETTNNISAPIAEMQFKKLNALIRKSRPILLKEKYACHKNINRTNSTILFFSKSGNKKNVIIDNECNIPNKLSSLISFIDEIVKTHTP